MSDDEQAIRDLVALWMTASKAGDTATTLTLMTDDVIFMAPGGRTLGKNEFAAVPSGTITGTAEVLEVQVHGDWAWARNFLDIMFTLPCGQASQLSGHTLGIYRKNAAGKWHARDANLLGPVKAIIGDSMKFLLVFATAMMLLGCDKKIHEPGANPPMVRPDAPLFQSR